MDRIAHSSSFENRVRSVRRGAIVQAAGLALLLSACGGPVESCPDAGPDGSSAVPDAGTDGGAAISAFEWLADPYVSARRLPGRMHLASSRFPEDPDGFDNDDFTNFVRIDGAEA